MPPVIGIVRGSHESTAILLLAIVLSFLGACTIKNAPVPPDIIPKIETLTPEDEQFGDELLGDLCEDYQEICDHLQYDQLVAVFDHLKQVAEVNHIPWHIHLFRDPEIVDVRAVHGNRIFVWSGFLDVVENEDEIAAILACEMAHVLARHTMPVQFSIPSEIMFGIAEFTTSVGIMFLTQGIVTIGGQGWLKWIYVDAADLDPLDREYSEINEREAAQIALLIISQSRYEPEALLNFWRRVEQDKDLQDKVKRLDRKMTPRERVAMLEDVFLNLPEQKE